MIIHAIKESDAKALLLPGAHFAGSEVGGGGAEGVLEGVFGEWSEIVDPSGIPGDIRGRILSVVNEKLLPGPPSRIAVRRYDRGHCSPPNKFHEQLPGSSGPDSWTVLFALQDSEVDAITYWTGEKFSRHFDRAGVGLHVAQDSWCWTSPVREESRYTLAIGGEQRWKS
ncbi:hypothetical protein ACFCXH_09770 [Streptomyces nojiriensis]|uniref:hypothetical protein n=1 Tax=Streptomyces nojiriensis TaxID=66374 RepID=UPI0035DE991E